MSNEISYQIRMGLVNGNLSDSFSTASLRVDQNTARLVRNTQPIGTTAELIEAGDIGTPGWSMFANISETDTDEIEIGNYTGGTFYPFMLLKAGEYQICRLAITTAQLYAKGNNGVDDVVLFYIIYND